MIRSKVAQVSAVFFIIISTILAFGSRTPVAHAAAQLTVTPVSWGVIGLDSNNLAVGPDTYMIGARACNTGNAVATNLIATFNWTTSNSNVNLAANSNAVLTMPSLITGACAFFYFNVHITRDSAAYSTSRGYRVGVSADNLPAVYTPSPRELYV